jgi:hypothetical protein
MDDFDKIHYLKLCSPQLAEFNFNIIESIDNRNQSEILNSNGKPIKKYRKYRLALDIKFKTIDRKIKNEQYTFGIKEAIIKIKCYGCKIPWETLELETNFNNIYEIKKESHNAIRAEFSSRAFGFTFDKGSKDTITCLKAKICMKGTEVKPEFYFRTAQDNEDILSETITSLILGNIEVSDRESQLEAVLMLAEIANVKPNSTQIIKPGILSRINLANNQQEIQKIKEELTGELPGVKFQFRGRRRIQTI